MAELARELIHKLYWPDKGGQVCSRRMLSFRMCMILGFMKYLLAFEQAQGKKDNPEPRLPSVGQGSTLNLWTSTIFLNEDWLEAAGHPSRWVSVVVSSAERKGKTMDVLEPIQDSYGDLEINRVGITKNLSVRWKLQISNWQAFAEIPFLLV